jgi:hypothetical protein
MGDKSTREMFDHVIWGGGAAGAAVTKRPSEAGNRAVISFRVLKVIGLEGCSSLTPPSC